MGCLFRMEANCETIPPSFSQKEAAVGRTVQQPILGEPLRLYDGVAGSFPKPGELVEIRGAEGLTKADRIALNLLVVNAWPCITESVEHVIKKSALRGTHDSTDRLSDTMQRLKSVQVAIRGTRDGKFGWYEDHLLGPTFRHDDPDGNLYYCFSDTVIDIIKESDHWGRLQSQVMLALSSKYSVALYEMIQKRACLKHRRFEEFPLEDLRIYLGVPEGKMLRWPDFRRFCLEPAVAEVAALSDCHVRV